MSRRLRDEIVGDLDSVLSEWRTVSQETQEKLRTLNIYYCNVHNSSTSTHDVIKQAKEDSNQINQHVQKHQKLAARASTATGDLKTQVQSSASMVEKMKKYGRPAAAGFTLLGGAIGLAIGMKYPGLGQPIAIGVGVVIGLVCFGLVGLILYFVLKAKAISRRKMWKDTLNENQEGLGMTQKIAEKRRVIREIKDNLNDIEENNFDSAVIAVINANNEYLA